MEYLSVIIIGKGRNARIVLMNIYQLQVSVSIEKKNTGAASATDNDSHKCSKYGKSIYLYIQRKWIGQQGGSVICQLVQVLQKA